MPMPPPLSHKQLNRIAAAAIEAVLTGQFKLKAHPAGCDEVVQGAAGERFLNSAVELHGENSHGRVSLKVPVPWLESLNASLGDSSEDSALRAGELMDLAGELANMIAGRIAAGLAETGRTCTLSTPSVAPNPQPQRESGGEISETCWTCAGGELTLKVEIN